MRTHPPAASRGWLAFTTIAAVAATGVIAHTILLQLGEGKRVRWYRKLKMWLLMPTSEPATKPHPQPFQFCDQCRYAQAKWRVTVGDAMSDLYFCNHHFEASKDVFGEYGYGVEPYGHHGV